MTFEPTLLYKSPGPHFAANGKTYAFLGVKDQKGLDKALADGWKLNYLEVVGLEDAPTAVVSEYDGLPDLETLTAQAEKLGIKVDKRWGAAKLAEMIGKT